MFALKLAYKASLELPEWAIDFFKDEISNQINTPFYPKVITPINENIDEIRTLKKRRRALNDAVHLLDAGILKASEFNQARSLLKTLNRYCVNGGSEGTNEKPFEV